MSLEKKPIVGVKQWNAALDQIDANETAISGLATGIVSGTPVNAVAADGTLTISGVAIDSETVIIGNDTYEFAADAAQSVSAGNIPIDITTFSTASAGTLSMATQPTAGDTILIGAGVQATGILTISGVAIDGETITTGSDTYEFAADAAQSVTSGNIPIDITAVSTASQGTLTIAVQPTSGDTMVIGTKTFTFVPLGTANADGEISVMTDLATVKVAIVAAINGTDGWNTASTVVTAANFAVNDCVLTALIGGVAGDLIATTSVFTNGGNLFDAVTLGTTTAGVDCIASAAVTAIVVASAGATETLTMADGAADTVDVTYDTVGTAGNIASTETMANGAFGSGTLTGGVDAVNAKTYTFVPVGTATADGEVSVGTDAATAQVALVAAINGTDGINTANLSVSAGTFAANDSVITAFIAGTNGDTITTTETFFAAGNVFDNTSLGTIVAGSDCTAPNAVTAIVTASASGTELVTLTDGAGDTVSVDADVSGVLANAIATTETMANGSFAAATLTGGIDGTVSTTAQTGQIVYYDASYHYTPTAVNTIADANWTRTTLASY